MGVMTRGALHLVISKQGFIDALAGKARSIPGGRNRRIIYGQYGLGIANVIGHRIFQLAICHGKGRVIGEGDRVSGMQVRPDLEVRVNVVGGIGAQTTDRGIDGDSAVMAAQAG